MWFEKYMTVYQNEADDQGSDLGGQEATTTEEVIEDDLNPDAEAFEALAAEMDDEDGEAISIEEESTPVAEADEPAEQTTEEEAPAAESQKPAEEEESQKPTAEEESQSNAEETEGVEEETPVEEESTPPTLEEYEAARTKTIDEVTKLYAFTNEEDIEHLRSNPEEALPKLAAELFYDVHQAVMQSVMQTFPQMLNQHNQVQAAAQAADDSFYSQWPMLNDPKYRADYERIGGMYKQLNPTATQEQFNREVGAQLLIANQIPFNTQTGQVITEEVIDDSPNIPHKPAQPSAAAPKPAAPQENEFEAFSREFDE